MKKFKKNIIIVVLLLLIILVFTLKDDFYGIINALFNSNPIYILILIIVILIGDFFKGCSFWVLIRKVKKDYKIIDSFLLILRSEFFYGLTPFALGGQPYQIYELKDKNDISYSDGANIVFKDTYGYQLALVSVSTIFLILNQIFNIVKFNNIINKFLLFGYIINVALIAVFEYLKYSKIKHNKMVDIFITFLSKIKIVKDKEKTSNKLNNELNKIRLQLKENDFNLVIKSYLFSILKIIMLGLAGYFSLKAININNINIITAVFVIIFSVNISSFVPTPGYSGGMEYGFLTLFAIYATGAKLNAAMLLWRFTGFYLLTLNGALMIIIKDKFKKKEKNNE